MAWHGALRIGCNCFLYCKIVNGVEKVCALFFVCLACAMYSMNEKRMREKEAREQWKGTEKGHFFIFCLPFVDCIKDAACLCVYLLFFFVCLSHVTYLHPSMTWHGDGMYSLFNSFIHSSNKQSK